MPNALPHFSYKAGLHEQHIEHRAGEQAQKHIPFPPLQRGGHGDGDQLRQCVVRGEHRVLEAVDEQQPDDREGQDGAEVTDERGRLAPLGEDEKGEKARRHRAEHDGHDGDHALRDGHGHRAGSSFFCDLLLTRKQTMMSAIAGSMKPSLPNTARQSAAQPRPVRAGRWSLASSH